MRIRYGHQMAKMKQIPSWPGYFADMAGNIYSIRNRWGTTKPRRLTPIRIAKGHVRVCLGRGDGTRRLVFIHHLILEAFGIVRPSDRHEVRHLNGKHADNRLANLRWGTRRENAADSKRHGTFPIGEKNGSSKLTEIDVRAIRRRYDHGESAAEIQPSYPQVCKDTILKVGNRTNWRWLGEADA